MTVSELITELQKYDPNKSVNVDVDAFKWREGSYVTVDEVGCWVIIKRVEY